MISGRCSPETSEARASAAAVVVDPHRRPDCLGDLPVPVVLLWLDLFPLFLRDQVLHLQLRLGGALGLSEQVQEQRLYHALQALLGRPTIRS